MVSGIIISSHEGLIRRSAQLRVKMTDNNDSMKDVSHTAPNGTSVEAVWERGRVPEEPEEEEE